MSTITLTPPADAASAAAQPRRRTWLAFAVVLSAALMDLLDSTVTQTAAPAIRHQLGASFAQLQWLTAAYAVAMGVTILLGGRLGDIVGRRRMLLSGCIGFVLTSALCACAPSATTLIGARALQGVTAAMMVPQGFGLIRELFGDAGQQKAFAVFGPVMGLGSVAGPIVGGALIDLNLAGSGWRAIFLINVPIGIATVLLGSRVLPRTAAVSPEHRLDPLSLLLSTGIGVLLIFPLIQGRQDGWPLWAFAMLVAGVALTVAFAVHQRHRVQAGRAPLVEPAILSRRPYLAGLGLLVGFIAGVGAMILALNVMFQTGLGFSPLACGVATLVIPLAATPGSIVSSILLRRLGRRTIHIGTAVMATGLGVGAAILLARGADLSAWDLTAPLGLAGFGMGMVFVPMFDVILAGVAPEHTGSASGLLEAVQQLSLSLGVALAGTALFDHVGRQLSRGAFVHGGADGLLVAVGLLGLAFCVTGWLPPHPRTNP